MSTDYSRPPETTGLCLLVCGGRDYDRSDIAYSVLDWIKLHFGVARVIQGGATGGDEMGFGWAQYRRVPCDTFKADWSAGKSGGPMRNQRMLDEGKPDFVVAFPGGRGTVDMVNRARRAGLRIMEIPVSHDKLILS